MARKPSIATAPPWFDLARYADAGLMDAGDWYVNLALRCAIARGHAQRALLLSHVRGSRPIVRRAEQEDGSLQHLHGMPPGFLAPMAGREPRSGVEYLRTHELYAFEKRLPDAIREHGARYKPGEYTEDSAAPEGFTAPLDHVFDARLLQVFARIDLACPDDVLVRDLREFLARVRAEFAEVGGVQPYADALRTLRGHKRAKLRTFAKINLLAVMDVDQWQQDETMSMRPAALARLLDIEPEDLREARKYAAVLRDGFALAAWLLPAARRAARA